MKPGAQFPQLVAITAVLASGKRILRSPHFQGRTLLYASHKDFIVSCSAPAYPQK